MGIFDPNLTESTGFVRLYEILAEDLKNVLEERRPFVEMLCDTRLRDDVGFSESTFRYDIFTYLNRISTKKLLEEYGVEVVVDISVCKAPVATLCSLKPKYVYNIIFKYLHIIEDNKHGKLHAQDEFHFTLVNDF